MIKCNNPWHILSSNECMLLFTRKYDGFRHHIQEFGPRVLTLYCASSAKPSFSLKKLTLLQVEFSRKQTLRCSLVHSVFR